MNLGGDRGQGGDLGAPAPGAVLIKLHKPFASKKKALAPHVGKSVLKYLVQPFKTYPEEEIKEHHCLSRGRITIDKKQDYIKTDKGRFHPGIADARTLPYPYVRTAADSESNYLASYPGDNAWETALTENGLHP
jgi:hypothetical protein